MTEQERPRTEAGRALWDHLAVAGRPSVERIADFILAIEAEGRQQARLEVRETLRRQGYRHLVALFQVEGRQQAVCEIREQVDAALVALDRLSDKPLGERVSTARYHLRLAVAGLNASEHAPEHAHESPPLGCPDCEEWFSGTSDPGRGAHGEASESGHHESGQP